MKDQLWRNFINKPQLNHYISSPAEVNFSQYGPTFAVSGTMTAAKGAILVQNICAEVSYNGEKAYRYMDWFAFRPLHYAMGNFSSLDLTMTSKFTISPDQAHAYNIIFLDNSTYSLIKPVFQAVKNAWADAVLAASQNEKQVDHKVLFKEFTKLKLVTDAAGRLKQENPWRAGNYSARIRVTTESPKQIFDVKKFFVLTAEEAGRLSQNAAAIVADICRQPAAPYACATPELKTKK